MRSTTVCLATWIALAVTSVHGVEVKTWISSESALAMGTADGVVIDDSGALSPAREFSTVWGPDPGVVWDLTRAGEAVFAGLSGPARVLRLDGRDRVETWFEGDEGEMVTAVAARGPREVFFAVSPGGKLYRATAPGSVEPVLDAGAEYVWDLLAAADGSLWIASGGPGRVQRYARGSLTSLLELDQDPARVLLEVDGEVLAATGERGRLIRFDRQRRPFVLHEIGKAEVVALARNASGLWALSTDTVGATVADKAPAAKPPGDVVKVTASPPANERAQGDDESKNEKRGKPAAKGASLYRVDEDGGVIRIWQSSAETPFAMVPVGDASVLVATGDEGRLREIDREGTVVRLTRFPSEQASAMVSLPGGAMVLAGTADARLSRLGPDRVRRGVYTGQPIDAGTHARWGRLRWSATGAGVRFAVRSGNTSDPDRTWSEWTPVDAAPGEDGGSTSVPPARWLQIRAELTRDDAGEGPRLHRFELSYAPFNRAPELPDVEIQAPGVAWYPGPAQNQRRGGPVVIDDPGAVRVDREISGQHRTTVRKAYEAGVRTFNWNATDPDGDAIVFRVELFGEREERGLLLADNLAESFLSVDVRGLADGRYRVRVTASDAPGNTPEDSRSTDRRSELFEVDNSRPRIDGVEAKIRRGALSLRFVASDPGGRIGDVQALLAPGRWTHLDPSDGVADSSDEPYEVVIPASAIDSGGKLLLRVTDRHGNVGGTVVELPQSGV